MKKIVTLFVVFLFIGITCSAIPQNLGVQDNDAIHLDVKAVEQLTGSDDGLMDSAWPMFCHDVRHTGRSPYGATGGAGVEKWKFRMDGLLFSSPAIDKNGTIYIESTNDHCLYALYANGTEKWRCGTGGGRSSPAIAEDGITYVGSYGGKLYAIFPNGTEKWRFKAGGSADWVYSSPVISDDGTIYFGVVGPGWDKGRIYAVYPNGTEKWHYDTGDWIYCSPCLDDDGIIYIGSNDYNMYAIYPNGTMKWKYETGGEIGSAPTIGDDGTVYFGSTDGYLYALYSNGTLKWRYRTGYIGASSPALAEDGTIYVGSNNGNIFSVDSDGNENWRFRTDDDIFASPAIDKYGIIYIGSYDGTLYALNPDGTVRWKYQTEGEISRSPVIGEDGTIYVGAHITYEPDFYAYLYAIEIIENEPPDKPTIDGETSGKIKTEYTYTAVTTEPDGDNVSYFFNWGDGTNSGWTGYVPSGIQVNESHTWSEKGTYEIKVKAQDVYGAESDWSTLEVTMPKSSQFNFNFPLISWLLERFPRMFPMLRLLFNLN